MSFNSAPVPWLHAAGTGGLCLSLVGVNTDGDVGQSFRKWPAQTTSPLPATGCSKPLIPKEAHGGLSCLPGVLQLTPLSL